MNVQLYILGRKLYINKINPISIYSIIWVSVMVLYESGLIKLYELSIKTWVVVILMQLFFVIGCYLARKSMNFGNNQEISKEVSYYREESILRKIIIILSLVSSIAIVTNVMMFVKIYGINLLKATIQIYIDRVNQLQEFETIPYLGAFIYIVMILIGVYIKKFGVKLFLLFPVILLFCNQLTSGGRSNLIFGLLLLSAPIIFKNKGKVKTQHNKKRFSKLKVVLICACFLGLFIAISQNRAEGQVISSDYASNLLIELSNGNVTFYKLLVYFTAPVGVLNAFLANPTLNFGGHSFLTIYNFLNKLGYNILTTPYQEFYFVPMRVNVGTYIRELIQDFTIAGALLIALLLGVAFSRSFLNTIYLKLYTSEIWASTMFTVIVMSFFDWTLRSSTFWIILIFGSVLGRWLDKKVRYLRLTEEKISNECSDNIKL
ncbi:O-antigen polymerase [Paenibacillus sp. 2TAB26]